MSETPTAPNHVFNQSQSDLWALYHANGFKELLPTCERIDIVPKRKRKSEDTFHSALAEYEEGAKFRMNGRTIAVIFWYTDAEGRTFETIRSLRIGDTVYDASVKHSNFTHR